MTTPAITIDPAAEAWLRALAGTTHGRYSRLRKAVIRTIGLEPGDTIVEGDIEWALGIGRFASPTSGNTSRASTTPRPEPATS